MSRHHVRLNWRRWQATRRAVFQRDAYRCRNCGRAGRLEADHVIPLHVDAGQNPYDPDGCQTLCRRCHIEKTRQENRREPTPAESAWRELVADMAGE